MSVPANDNSLNALKTEPTLGAVAKQQRPVLQQAMLGMLRGRARRESLTQIGKVFSHLKQVCPDEASYRFWWLAEGFALELRNRNATPDQKINLLMRDLDRQIKLLIDTGSIEYATDTTILDIGQRLDDYLASSAEGQQRLEECIDFDPPQVVLTVPDEVELQQQIADLKSALVLLRASLEQEFDNEERNTRQLEALVPTMQEMVPILASLNMHIPANLLQQRIADVSVWVKAGDYISEDQCVALAYDVLLVEVAIEQGDRFARNRALSASAAANLNDSSRLDLLRDAYFENVRSTVVREVQATLQGISDTLRSYANETDQVPDWLMLATEVSSLRGVLCVLAYNDAAAGLQRLETVLHTFAERQPELRDSAVLVHCSTVISAQAGFVKQLALANMPDEAALAVIEPSLTALETLASTMLAEPEPATESSIEPLAESEPEAPPEPEFPLESSIEPELDEQAIDIAPMPEAESEPKPAKHEQVTYSVPKLVPADVSGLDPELLEIFFEEARGELDSMREQVPRWRNNLADDHALTTIRRSFHTLKGSGRMVGLTLLGEFAWAFEQLLNRVIDGSILVEPALLDAIDDARQQMQVLIDAGREPVGNEVAGFEALMLRVTALMHGDLETARQIRQAPAVVSEEPLEDVLQTASPAQPTPEPEPQPSVPVGGGIAADIDPELVEAFFYEAAEVLDSGELLLQRLSADPDDVAALSDLRRGMHTLKGSSRMAGLETIGDLAHAAESILQAMGDKELAIGGRTLDGVQSALDTLNDMLTRVRSGTVIQPVPELIEHLQFLQNSQPKSLSVQAAAFESEASEQADAGLEQPNTELPNSAIPIPAGDAEQELLGVFLTEAAEVLDASEITLQRWSGDRDNADLLNDLRREMHTLKGSSRMAGLTVIGNLSHAIESVLEAISKQQLEPNAAPLGLLQNSLDTLNGMLARIKAGRELAPAEDIINELHALLGLEPVESNVPIALPKVVKPGTSSGTSVRRRRRNKNIKMVGADTDTIRVNASLMNNLINQMGESSIYRARVDQGVNSIRFNLGELDQTVSRLRQHLRRLEIETEAQILFRYEAAPKHGPSEEFDPLELDRFSELQQLSRQLMEAVEDLSNIKNSMEDQSHGMSLLLDQQSKVNKELQQGLMQTRMVRFSSMVPRLRRVVRQVANDEAKKAELVISGSESEVDRSVLDNMVAPLEHMLRNAIFHGLEAPEKRRAIGKSEVGQIALDLRREGAELVLKLSDDGAGLNYAAIRRKAEQRGEIEPDQDVTEQELIALILKPGFSIAEKVSMVAGRGVGMDVLNEAIKAMRGALHIESREGVGSTFTIRLPFSLAVTQALLVESGGETYAVPLLSVEAVTRLDGLAYKSYIAGDTVHHTYNEHRYPLHSLAAVFGNFRNPHDSDDFEDIRPPALLFRSAEASAALQVDNVLGNQEIIVKPVGPQLHTVPGISGATVLADGRVVVVLELAALVRNLASQAQRQAEAQTIKAVQDKTEEKLTAMVIDDSITMRKVLARFLERLGFTVTTAKDGVEAISMLEDHVPHLAFLDIEMPRMDGFEVMGHVRNQPHLKHLPVIMVTSRSGEKHRTRGARLGVNDYLIKPYQEEEMIKSIRRLLQEQGLEMPTP